MELHRAKWSLKVICLHALYVDAFGTLIAYKSKSSNDDSNPSKISSTKERADDVITRFPSYWWM
jgi:hypothetical protein